MATWGRSWPARCWTAWAAWGFPVGLAAERIRATVIGASQFSVQLSGNTIHLFGPIDLPEHNVPVVASTYPPTTN